MNKTQINKLIKMTKQTNKNTKAKLKKQTEEKMTN